MAAPPSPEWGRERIPRAEKLWLFASIAVAVGLFSLWMPLWHLYGFQNSVGEVYRVDPGDFAARVQAYVQRYRVGEEAGFPVVRPPVHSPPAPELRHGWTVSVGRGGDVYIAAMQFTFVPQVTILKAGIEYTLHISALDVQHGFSIIGPFQWSIQIYPGYEYVLKFTPTKPGTYLIVCNEFCGLGHHAMIARIVVEP